jgi:hypothetical protein
MSTDWGEDRLEDYARYDEAEIREAMRSVKAAVARGGNQTYKELLDLFWPDPVLRSSDLSGEEAVRLYSAISFAMWMFGPSAIMNTHVTILWQTLQIFDHQHAMRLQGKFLNRARKWSAVGLPGTHPDRKRRHARTGEGFPFRYVYACENATQQASTHTFCVRYPGSLSRPSLRGRNIPWPNWPSILAMRRLSKSSRRRNGLSALPSRGVGLGFAILRSS